MVEETAAGAEAPIVPVPPLAAVLGGRFALGLGLMLLLLLGTVEAAQRQAVTGSDELEQVVQMPAPITSPAAHPDVSPWDPGDNP
jgi:hypothetical protein